MNNHQPYKYVINEEEYHLISGGTSESGPAYTISYYLAYGIASLLDLGIQMYHLGYPLVLK